LTVLGGIAAMLLHSFSLKGTELKPSETPCHEPSQ
jgi:hypothetical protein